MSAKAAYACGEKSLGSTRSIRCNSLTPIWACASRQSLSLCGPATDTPDFNSASCQMRREKLCQAGSTLIENSKESVLLSEGEPPESKDPFLVQFLVRCAPPNPNRYS